MPNTLLTISEAANECPRRTSATSIWRWARKGLKARTGERVHLRHVRVGGMVMIPRDALGEFFQSLADADAEHFDRRPTLTPKPQARKSKRTAHEQAKAALAARGL